MQESVAQEFAIMLSVDGNENMRGSELQRVLQNTGLIELSRLF